MIKKKIRLYTDGSILKNLNGSFGWLVVDDSEVIEEKAKRLDGSTISVLEAKAILEGLKSCIELFPKENFLLSIDVYSDSRMSVNALTTYFKDWEKRAKDGVWYATTGKPVANQDIFREIKQIEKELKKVNYIHVSGHADSDFNNRVDRLVRTLSAEE